MDKSQDPSTPSLAHAALRDDWSMIRAIRAGAKAIKAAGETYLPKFPAEDADEYDRRKKSAPWRPEFEDALRALSAKPFAKEVSLAGTPSPEMVALAEDVDGQGNNLHNFAKEVFEGGVALGAHGILVDYPPTEGARTRADERAAGARPYWVSINADDILALRTEQRGGRRIVSYLRIREMAVEVEGFAETAVPKIREIMPGAWKVWREQKTAAGATAWAVESEGVMTLDEVPFVFFATNERKGDQYVLPPLIDLAVMQIELYRAGSNKEQIFTIAGSPMLTANGMAAPEGAGVIETGPGRVLYAPGAEGITTSWDYIQPAAANLKEIREDIAEIIADLRRLGMQPMLPRITGTVTATASGIDAAKAHSTLQAWALALKDALEQAFVFSAAWIAAPRSAPEVSVHTGFAVGLYGAEEVRVLLDARKEAQISQETLWDEFQRRGVLGPQFDRGKEEKRLLDEMPGDDEADALAATLPRDKTVSPDQDPLQ
ncbi:DUF4055 domain-containing protein [Ancylobacter sp. VNQ12]|uniref:DUF4055 domain-containing protein n=1 Tax=Ancylobacter sp. VNQ12 TaxID=3400920 RepID=UPI003BFBDB89